MISRTPTLDPVRPWQFLAEEELSSAGEIVVVNTVFLTNRQCPWRCVMCDLWKNTLTETVSKGSIPAQIEYALARLPPARVIKLYNSGSFFDPAAIPVADYPAIARHLDGFERVIVESHPALIGENCFRFRDLIPGRLEVAMGLETVHVEVLSKLNKRMTLEQFASSAAALRRNGIALRAFVLVKPPFLSEHEAIHWAERSIEFACSCGATAVSLIPTRGGNDALDDLAAQGDFAPPRIRTLETCQEYGVKLKQGRVFADLWDLEQFSTCGECYAARYNRLREMNLTQTIPEPIGCRACESLGWQAAYLLDILRSVTPFSLTSGQTHEEFLEDTKTQDAVLRRFLVAGEAAARLSPETCAEFPDIPFRKIAGMRNRVVHDYGNVDFEIVWETIQTRLPLVFKELHDFFAECDEA